MITDEQAQELQPNRFIQPLGWVTVVQARPRESAAGGPRAAGGPGSGNHGHAGRPGQVGGSAADVGEQAGRLEAVDGWESIRSTDGPDEFFYHVTLEPAAKRILAEQELRGGNAAFMGRAEPEAHSRGRVFLTDRDGVFFWAERVEAHAVDKYDDPPDVKVIRIPKSAVQNVEDDPAGTRDARAKAYVVRGSVKLRTAGGPGSGNFGHAGRPGAVGGSAPRGGPVSEEEVDAQLKRQAKLDKIGIRAEDMALEMGFDRTRINVVDKDMREFQVGDQTFHEAGHYNPVTGKIELNVRATNVGSDAMVDTYGVVAHEISHAMFDTVEKARDAEHRAIRDMPEEEFDIFFKRNGYPRPEKLAELKARFPISALYAETVGDAYFDDSHQKLQAAIAEDGHSEYGISYWQPAAQEMTGSLQRAIDETLAEVTRFQLAEHSWVNEPKKPSEDSVWWKLAEGIRKHYARVIKK